MTPPRRCMMLLRTTLSQPWITSSNGVGSLPIFSYCPSVLSGASSCWTRQSEQSELSCDYAYGILAHHLLHGVVIATTSPETAHHQQQLPSCRAGCRPARLLLGTKLSGRACLIVLHPGLPLLIIAPLDTWFIKSQRSATSDAFDDTYGQYLLGWQSRC